MHNEIDDGYEKQNGSVLKIETNKFIVRVERDPADCDGCKTCAVKALCRGKDDGHMELPVPYNGTPPLEKGDAVQIAYRPTNAALAAIVMFLPSLLGLFFGGFIGHWMAGESDSTFLIGCFAGFFLGLALSFILARTIPALRPDVKFLRKIETTGAHA